MIDMSPLHRELAAEAFDGVAFQAQATARFLDRADDAAALSAYERILSIFREFIVPEMKALANKKKDTLTTEAAVEWRAENEKRRAG